MTLALNALATEKIHNGGFLSIFNKTFKQTVKESVDFPVSGSLVKQITSAPFPIFIVASYVGTTVSISLRILGFDVPLKTYTLTQFPQGAEIPINWSWNGFSLVGSISLA